MHTIKGLLDGILRFILLILMVSSLQSCYHYRILTTQSDPGTEYRDTTLWSYCWGLINKPKDFTVKNCTETSGLDEVRVTNTLGSLLLTLISLGIVAPIKIEWKCHKPCPRSGHI